MKDDNKKMSKNKEKKAAIVAEIAEKVQKSKAFVFANYQGMTHKQIEELKKALKAVNADFVVTKNTLLKLALSSVELKDASQKDSMQFESPTATMFIFADPLGPIKALAKSIKTLKLPLIKFGIVDGQVLQEKDITKLSTLPTRDVLVAQVVEQLKAPLYGLHRALNWNLQQLVLTLHAIQKTKSQ